MWQGSSELLQEVTCLISEAISTSNNQRQKEIASRISVLAQDPSFSCYLITILANATLPQIVRQSAGHTLKGILEKTPLLPSYLVYIQQKILENLLDESISSAISSIASTLYIVQEGWPSLLNFLSTNLIHPNSLVLLDHLFEDISTYSALAYMLSTSEYRDIIQTISISLIDLAQQSNLMAFKAMNKLVKIMPTPLMPLINKYLQVLISSSLQPEVAEGIFALSCSRKDLIKKHFPQCAALMTQFMETEKGAIGCNFWMEFIDEVNLIQPYLERILFVILKNLRLTDNDLMMMMPENEDFRFEKEESERNWSKRRESAVLLDNLALKFGGACFLCLQRDIQELLFSQEWVLVESGLLALGALAPGSGDSLNSALPSFLPFLLQLTKHAEKMVVAMAYWTISRFTEAISQMAVLNEYIGFILTGMTHKHSIVQQAACTAFCVLVTRAPDDIFGSINQILEIFGKCLLEYKGKAMINLLDAIGSLTDVQGPFFQSAHYVPSLFLPVYELFLRLQPDDRLIWTVTECLCSILLAMGALLSEFMPALFQKSCLLISVGLEGNEKQFAVKGLELAGVVIENASNIEYSPVINLLLTALEEKDVSVRQYAAATVGDILYKKIPLPETTTGQLANKLYSCLVVIEGPDDISNTYSLACNNAACALAELGLTYPDSIFPHVQAIIKVLVDCTHKTQVPQVKSNLMCSVGKLGNVNPGALAEYLVHTLYVWSEHIGHSADPSDKFLSFKGMLAAVFINIKALDNTFQYFAKALVDYKDMPEEAKAQAKTLLNTLKSFVGNDRWESYVSALPFRQELLVNFQV